MDPKAPQMILPAVALVLKHGFRLIQYGESTMRRYGVPQVSSKLEYVISEDELESASNILQENGFEWIPPDSDRQQRYGDFETKGRYHSSTLDDEAMYLPIQLLLSSLVHVSFDNLEQDTSFEQPDFATNLLKLPQHCISLIRTIVNIPLDRSRRKPLSELAVVITHGIFEYQYYDKDWEEPEESEEERHQKVCFALEKVRSWDLPEDANWERELLESLIDGSMRLHDIPYKEG